MGGLIFTVALRITGPKDSLERCFDMLESEDFPENFEFDLYDEDRSTILKDDTIAASFEYSGDEWPIYIPELISDNISDLKVYFRICKEEDVPLKFVAGIYMNKVLSDGYYWEADEDDGSEFGPDSRVVWSGVMPKTKEKAIKKPKAKKKIVKPASTLYEPDEEEWIHTGIRGQLAIVDKSRCKEFEDSIRNGEDESFDIKTYNGAVTFLYHAYANDNNQTQEDCENVLDLEGLTKLYRESGDEFFNSGRELKENEVAYFYGFNYKRAALAIHCDDPEINPNVDETDEMVINLDDCDYLYSDEYVVSVEHDIFADLLLAVRFKGKDYKVQMHSSADIDTGEVFINKFTKEKAYVYDFEKEKFVESDSFLE